MSDATHNRYLELAREVVEMYPSPTTILKTDCWNEATDFGPFPDATYYIDVNAERVAEARRRYPNSRFDVADIRTVTLPDASLDVILDFSTLDHIPDPATALDNYLRMLRPRGRLLLMVWLADGPTAALEQGTDGDRQYWFSATEFFGHVQSRFSVERFINFPETHNADWIPNRNENRWLQGFIACK